MTTHSITTPYVSACPVGCGAALEPTQLHLPEGSLRRCVSCGQLVSAASESRYWETMASFNAPGFNQPAPREIERRRRIAQRRLKTIGRLLGKSPPEIRLVDIGCSRGQFVDFAARAGFAAEGVEPAPDIAAAARESGLNVRTGLLEEQHYPDTTFDAASLFEVVEHLREPLSLLQECRRLLKPDGILIISTGNAASWTVASMGARWDYFHIEKDGGHISFFNPQSITTLATVCGFTVERIETSRVKFHEKGDVSPVLYTAGKIAAELLNLPARLAGRGHDMLAYLRRR
ncbi:MAG: class I SAM-dependent methyltransferase [Burkholderiales bacterium]